MRSVIAIILSVIVVAQAYAADKPRAKPAPAAQKTYRFDMTQNGKRMSANDFDRWMKANGIRVAKGPQAAKPKPKPKPKSR